MDMSATYVCIDDREGGGGQGTAGTAQPINSPASPAGIGDEPRRWTGTSGWAGMTGRVAGKDGKAAGREERGIDRVGGQVSCRAAGGMSSRLMGCALGLECIALRDGTGCRDCEIVRLRLCRLCTK
ncbi:hypothetical protein CALCODRAFT_371761 [Calocera cornea HHB12733]|uniref:Uncharacterized protein n=1 Tax=Calocera cornea HHB12733 TaxID=1353952 RepID=A0A165EHL1_9BASI|nr:hypothetical protein CALCODRAFT_371761 [Calocera cornea HHB12733]